MTRLTSYTAGTVLCALILAAVAVWIVVGWVRGRGWL